ncbi:MAG: hypothetical protein R3234_07835, partial [Thermoanaerobaculia bacterium]|nr:hypothetical protein [Thermoanaerobaculia bacterium]
MILLRFLAALVLLLGWSLAAWTFAQRLFPEERVLRGLGVLVLLPWMLSLAFWALAGLGQFRLGIALGVSAAVVGALAWWRRGAVSRCLADDLGRLGSLGREAFSGWTLVVSIPVVALAGLRLLRGTLAPPLAWDALTYRLFKAGTWVQT